MTPSVLIVDDTEDNRLVLSDVLEGEGYALREAVDGVDALEQIERHPPDLVLLDIMMPRMDGIECCRRLKADERTCGIPVILVTALGESHHVVEGLDAGAADYVRKPLTGPVVRARVRVALRSKLALDELRTKNDEIQRLASMLEKSNDDLKSLALHDSLTGLPNRLLLMDRLARTIERGRRERDLRFALLFLDLDRFKQVNDTMGHAAGDELLIAIAGRLGRTLRGGDTVAGPHFDALPTRLGGDEFVALVEGYERPEHLASIVERLHETLDRPYAIQGLEVVSKASIGIVTNERGYDSPEEMLRDADAAMYRAKQAGRGCHVYFDDRMQCDLEARRDRQRRFHAAVRSGALDVLYEPVVRLDDGRLHALEVVARWPQPGCSSASGSLVALAAETGMLLPLSRLMLETACGCPESWFAASRRRLVIKATDEMLRESGFAPLVGEILDQAALDPSGLILLVPEHVLRRDDTHSRRALAALLEHGVELAVDASERGTLALMQPREIDVASMRIGRELTVDLDNRHYAAIVHALTTLAHNLGVRVTATDVRDRAHLAQLQALECDFGQGPLFGGPLTASQCERLALAERIEVDLT